MKIAHFHCASGVSGDMCLGALVDAGASLTALRREIKKLRLRGYTISATEVMRAGLRATKVHVRLTRAAKGAAPEDARKLRHVRAMIKASTLAPDIKQKSLAVFQRIFEAEARVHGSTPGKVHLHELGAVDAMVDILGTVICLDLLAIERVTCSPINLGSGTVETSHGSLPVPAPATAELLAGAPVYCEGQGELATPTGAALMTTLASEYSEMPPMRLLCTGTGAGGMDTAGRPNILRTMIGQQDQGAASDTVTVIETNIDDMNPEIYGHVMELLFETGALDVWLTPVIMKKSRPGTVLSVMCDEAVAPALSEIILTETTTLGLRLHTASRTALMRQSRKVQTPYGPIRLKDAYVGGQLARTSVEYEDAHAAARRHKVPLREVMHSARLASEAHSGRARRAKKH